MHLKRPVGQRRMILALMLQSNATVISPGPILFYRPYLIYTTPNLILTLSTLSIEILAGSFHRHRRDLQLKPAPGDSLRARPEFRSSYRVINVSRVIDVRAVSKGYSFRTGRERGERGREK